MTRVTSAGPEVFKVDPTERRFPRLEIAKPTAETQAVLSKVISDPLSTARTATGRRVIAIPDDTLIKQISDRTANAVSDSERMFQLLPDNELAMQILVSSILSPKDMVSTTLDFFVETGSMEQELVGAMLQGVEEYFDKSYKIKKILKPILEDCLFFTGSYPLLVLPENTLDEAINSPYRVSVESIRTEFERGTDNLVNLGFLGPVVMPPKAGQRSSSISLESMYGTQPVSAPDPVDPVVKDKLGHDLMINVTDNFSVLKLTMLRDKVRQDRIQDMISMRHIGARLRPSMESDGNDRPPISTSDVEASLYRRRKYRNVPVLPLATGDTLKRDAIGHPLVMKLPSESVIPVHVPGNPDEHIGYFVLLDESGNPLAKAQTADYYTDLTANINGNRDMVSQLTASTQRATSGRESHEFQTENAIVRAYTDLVEENLLNRLRNGVNGKEVEISKPQEVYRVMFARALASMRTQLLYVPAELMTYIAFDYNRYGVGTSLLEKSRILGSMRSLMLFANTMAMIKNSVARQKLNITLDPNDPDPTRTVEFLIHEFAKMRQASFPLGASNPLDIISFLESAGVTTTVTGNAGYPDTKVDVEDYKSDKVKPDTDLLEQLRDMQLMSMGLSPETVNQGKNVEFATTVVTSNLLLSKRVKQYQEVLCEHVQTHVQTYTTYSGYLLQMLRDIARKHKSSVGKKKQEEAKQKTALDKDKDKSADTSDKPSSTDASSTLDTSTTSDTASTASTTDTSSTDDAGAKIKPEGVDRSKNPGALIITDPERQVEGHSDEIDRIVFTFIKALRVSLPEPDTATLETKMLAFDKYTESIDKALKAHLAIEFLNDSTIGELAPTVEATIAVVKAYFQRQWLRKNNVFPELNVLNGLGDEDDPFDLLDIQTQHMEGIMNSFGGFMKKMKAYQKEMGIETAGLGTGASMGGSSFGSSSTPGGDLGLGGDGLGGDLGEDKAQQTLDASSVEEDEQEDQDQTSTDGKPAKPATNKPPAEPTTKPY